MAEELALTVHATGGAAQTVLGGAGQAVPGEDELEKKLEKKRAKVRSAWISFVGRIVAQIMGAVATISLGLMIVQKYHAPVVSPAAAAAPVESRAVLPVRLVTPGEIALAVLPLEDVSADGDSSFARGMTDALITDLFQLEGIRVVSRTSSAAPRAAGQLAPEIAKALGVDYIVDGTVTRVEGRVRVTVRLVDARRDENVLAQNYVRPLRQVLSIQAEVARAVARGVQATLAATPGAAPGVVSRRKPELLPALDPH